MINWLQDKVIPSLIVGLVIGIFVMYIDVQELKRVAKEYKKRADITHEKQWEFIKQDHERVIRLQEKCIIKETYYINLLKAKNGIKSTATTVK